MTKVPNLEDAHISIVNEKGIREYFLCHDYQKRALNQHFLQKQKLPKTVFSTYKSKDGKVEISFEEMPYTKSRVLKFIRGGGSTPWDGTTFIGLDKDSLTDKLFWDSLDSVPLKWHLEEKNHQDYLLSTVTINGHGSKSSLKDFTLPDGIWVLVPDSKGLTEAYSLCAPCSGETLEEIIYSKKSQNGITFQNGWKLYTDGEEIPNLGISSFGEGEGAGGEAITCESIKSSTSKQKIHIESRKAIIQCQNRSELTDCLVPAITNKKKMTTFYEKSPKYSFKICGRTTLEDIVKKINNAKLEYRQKIITAENLKRKSTPIILIPFTCNGTKSCKIIKGARKEKGYNISDIIRQCLLNTTDKNYDNTLKGGFKKTKLSKSKKNKKNKKFKSKKGKKYKKNSKKYKKYKKNSKKYKKI